MTPMEKAGWTPLPHSDEDRERVKRAPDSFAAFPLVPLRSLRFYFLEQQQ